MSNPLYDHPNDDPLYQEQQIGPYTVVGASSDEEAIAAVAVTSKQKPRDERLEAEIEKLRGIYRTGTSDHILRRAAITALMDRGEW